jgi:hypothetical protein
MATGKAKVTLRGRFPAGTKVGLHRRVGDGFEQNPVKTATTDKSSETKFDGLDAHAQFFAVAEVDGERRAVGVTAKPALGPHPDLATTRHAHREALREQHEAAAASAEAATKKDPLAGSPALGGPDPSRQIVTGSRSTTSSQRGPSEPVVLKSADGLSETRFASATAGVPNPDAQKAVEVQPAPRQEDAGDVPQRSATLTGEATPVDPDEVQPQIRQDDVPEGTPQRSDTELGAAAITRKDEVQPRLKQEDVPKGVQQRSDTELGEAEPIPGGTPIEQKQRRDSVQAQAEGATPEKPTEAVTEGADGAAKAKRSSGRKSSAKKSSGSTKASRSAAAKKAAATRKRNARKSS